MPAKNDLLKNVGTSSATCTDHIVVMPVMPPTGQAIVKSSSSLNDSYTKQVA